jgi:hypothetical protein
MSDGQYGISGWKEFHRNRQDILDEVNRVRQLITNRSVKTAHGVAGEAYIRKWLSEFLPKKYGVTSGYVVPNLYGDANKLYHYDVIIYDSLEAPVLWIEGNSDNSDQGKYRAIPAKYVKAVYEVKSTLSVKTVKEVLDKLNQLQLFKHQLDDKFSSAAIFIDLPSENINNKKILPALLKGCEMHGFWGGVVLHCEIDKTATGVIHYSAYEKNEPTSKMDDLPLITPIDDVQVIGQEDGSIQLRSAGAGAILTSDGEKTWYVTKVYNKQYSVGALGVDIAWSRSGFSHFAMEVLRTLEGLERGDTNQPSFGVVFDYLNVEKAKFQNSNPSEGEPQLTIGIEKSESSGQFIDVIENDEMIKFTIAITALNSGPQEIELSNDKFKNIVKLSSGKNATLIESIAAPRSDQNKHPQAQKELDELISGDKPISFKKRFVYRIKDSKDHYSYFCTAHQFHVYRNKFETVLINSYTEFGDD